MLDILFVTLTLLFFVASWAFVKGCDRLWRGPPWNTYSRCWLRLGWACTCSTPCFGRKGS